MSRQKGATTIQFLLVLPILLVIIIAGMELWKIYYVKQTMNDAAYQGVRLLLMQPLHGRVTEEVRRMVQRYVYANPFVAEQLAGPEDENLQVVLDWEDPPICGAPVSVDVRLRWTVGVSFGNHEWVSFLGGHVNGLLNANAEGWVICESD